MPKVSSSASTPAESHRRSAHHLKMICQPDYRACDSTKGVAENEEPATPLKASSRVFLPNKRHAIARIVPHPDAPENEIAFAELLGVQSIQGCRRQHLEGLIRLFGVRPRKGKILVVSRAHIHCVRLPCSFTKKLNRGRYHLSQFRPDIFVNVHVPASEFPLVGPVSGDKLDRALRHHDRAGWGLRRVPINGRRPGIIVGSNIRHGRIIVAGRGASLATSTAPLRS